MEKQPNSELQPTPADSGKPESIENMRAYVEFIRESESRLENIELAPDKSALIKFKDQKEPIVFKSPNSLLYSGPKQGELATQMQRKEILSLGLKAQGHTFLQFDLKYSDFSDEDSLAALAKELETGYVCATQSLGADSSNRFMGIDIQEEAISTIDQAILEIKNESIADRLRLSFLYNKLVKGLGKDAEAKKYLSDIAESEPAFVDRLLEYSIRSCLTSGHEVSIPLFDFLRSKPEFYSRLDDIHKTASLPYLLERDLYMRAESPFTPENKRQPLLQDVTDTVRILNIDMTAIQQKLENTGSSYKYLQKLS